MSMPAEIFVIIGLVIAVYVAVFMFQKHKKEKIANALNSLNLDIEFANISSYHNELLYKDFAIVRKQYLGASIDAFMAAITDYSMKDQLKDTAKNSLKTLATAGMVKFHTVNTPKYLVIVGDELHLLDTDTDGKVSERFVFKKDSLLTASIEELNQKKDAQQKVFSSIGLKDLKKYMLKLNVADKTISLVFYDYLSAGVEENAGLSALFTSNTKSIIRNKVVAKHFMKIMGERFSNLKVM